MTRRWQFALAAIAVAGSVVAVLALAGQPRSTGSTGPPGSTATPSSLPTSGALSDSGGSTSGTGPTTGPRSPVTPTGALATPMPTATIPGPPGQTAHVAERYLTRYQARYIDWDTLLRSGARLPEASKQCRAAWGDATRDRALDWSKAGYLCLDRLTGKGFKPQGVAGSSTAAGYPIGGLPAGQRDIVLVSSYSSVREPDLRFPHDPGRTEATRLTVIDLDHRRYVHVELVRPVADGTLTALDSHGSGFAWVGQYLYSSSRGSLWMYNADDLMRIDGRYVLPAVARWSVQGAGGLSSITVDRSAGSTRLTGINYSEHGTAWTQSFELGPDGMIRPGSSQAGHRLDLIADYGPGPARVRSSRSSEVPGSNYQGIGVSGRHRFVNSSSLLLGGRRHGDQLVIMRRNTVIARFAMPSQNLESLYLDRRRGNYVTVTEHGPQFLFWLPIDHLLDRAER